MKKMPLAASLALVALACGVSVARAAAPVCLTPLVPDEPPCNPYLAQSIWAAPHRSSYELDSSPYPGPEPGSPVFFSRVQEQGAPIFINFTSRYADGGSAAWVTALSTPDQQLVYKFDVGTGTLIASSSSPSTTTPTQSGAYSLLDHNNDLIVARNQDLVVYGDAVPGNRFSGISTLRRFRLPRSALCRPNDVLTGLVMLYDGWIAFVTRDSVIGVIPDDVSRMNDANLHTLSINGDARCQAATASGDMADARSESTLEETTQSQAADETGAFYTVTDHAQYKDLWNGHALTQVWRAPYASDGFQGGIRQGKGSGTSPTLMGTGPGDDKFVVITDGKQVMNLDLFWRDAIPAGWKPIAPGVDRRIACQTRVDFGNPNIQKVQSEQSVVVRGYSSVVVNNSLNNTTAFDQLPLSQEDTLAALAGGDPTNAPHGMERIDWNPETHTCHPVWSNTQVSIPNGVPSLSTATNTIYAIGQRNGVWGLEGIDFSTGVSNLRVDASASPNDNSFYSDAVIAPGGAIWTGGFGAIGIYRSAVPEPSSVRLGCRDIEPPAAQLLRQGVTLRDGVLTIRGTAHDTACGRPAPVARVELSVARELGRDRCRSILGTSRKMDRTTSCESPTFVTAHGTRRWSFSVRRRLAAGRYLIQVFAVDQAGNQQDPPSQRVLTVRSTASQERPEPKFTG